MIYVGCQCKLQNRLVQLSHIVLIKLHRIAATGGILQSTRDQSVKIGIGHAKRAHAFGNSEAFVEIIDEGTKALIAARKTEILGHAIKARLNGRDG